MKHLFIFYFDGGVVMIEYYYYYYYTLYSISMRKERKKESSSSSFCNDFITNCQRHVPEYNINIGIVCKYMRMNGIACY